MEIKITTKNIPIFTSKEYGEYRKCIKDICEAWSFRTINNIKIDLSGNRLKVKTGRLRNSIQHKINQTATKTKIQIGSWSVPYAEIHDKKSDTIIQPKNVNFLTVPVNETIKGRARQYSNTKVIKSFNKLFLVQVNKGGWVKPLFSLKKQVKIRGTGYLTDNINNMVPMLKLQLSMGTEKELNIKLNKKRF